MCTAGPGRAGLDRAGTRAPWDRGDFGEPEPYEKFLGAVSIDLVLRSGVSCCYHEIS